MRRGNLEEVAMKRDGRDSAGLRPFIDRIRWENEVEADLVARLHAEAFEEAKRLGTEMGRADFEVLIAELDADARDLSGLFEENRRAQGRLDHGAIDRLDWAALGYTIHNIYGVMENYCLRIATFFENGLDRESWNKDLLRRMTLTVGDLRPAFIDDETLLLLDELRSFRHVFRNLYARPLDPERVGFVQAKVKPAFEAFLEAHAAYKSKLEAIARGLE